MAIDAVVIGVGVPAEIAHLGDTDAFRPCRPQGFLFGGLRVADQGRQTSNFVAVLGQFGLFFHGVE